MQRAHWYAAINVEIEPPEHKHPRESVGIDVGIKTLAVLSDGVQYENQVLLRSRLRKLKRLNRELSRRQEGSGRWNRTRKKLVKLHRRIANKRLDYTHKMTTGIARTYRIIGVEDLNVPGMLRNRRRTRQAAYRLSGGSQPHGLCQPVWRLIIYSAILR